MDAITASCRRSSCTWYYSGLVCCLSTDDIRHLVLCNDVRLQTVAASAVCCLLHGHRQFVSVDVANRATILLPARRCRASESNYTAKLDIIRRRLLLYICRKNKKQRRHRNKTAVAPFYISSSNCSTQQACTWVRHIYGHNIKRHNQLVELLNKHTLRSRLFFFAEYTTVRSCYGFNLN